MKRPALPNLSYALTAVALTLLPDAALAKDANNIQSLTDFGSLEEVPKVIFLLLIRFLPAIATIYMVISGYRYIVSQGNPDLMEKAKKNLTYAVVGVIVSYSAFLIVRLIGKQLNLGAGLGL